MIWFYARKGHHFRCEIRQQVEGDRFELIITEPDGRERVEVFDDAAALGRRSAALEHEWMIKGWDGPFRRDY